MIESSLYQAFIKELARMRVTPEDKILVGVSGGIDSMVLLNLFVIGGYNVAVANVNFNLRGQEGAEDQLFVQQWCGEHDVKCFVTQFDTKDFACQRKISIEMAARDLRYEWFASLLSHYEFKYLAVAHNANDNAETLLLNLSRGTGIRGLSGMSLQNGSTIRPLLFAHRAEIEEFARTFSISYREDSTNAENIYKRNKIRNQILPLFAQINPSIIKTLNEEMTHFRDSYLLQRELVKNLFVTTERDGDTDKFLICSNLRKQYQVCQIELDHISKIIDKYNEAIARIAFSSFLADYDFSYSTSEDMWHTLLAQLKAFDSTKLFFSDDRYVAVIERNKLKIYKRSLLEHIDFLANFSIEIGEDAREIVLPFGDNKEGNMCYRLTFDKIEQSTKTELFKEIDSRPQTISKLYIDRDKISYPLKIRFITDGDTFSPFGLKGTKRVNDYLTEKKIDTQFKPLIPVVESNGQIVALAGIEIDNKVRISPNSKILTLEVSVALF